MSHFAIFPSRWYPDPLVPHEIEYVFGRKKNGRVRIEEQAGGAECGGSARGESSTTRPDRTAVWGIGRPTAAIEERLRSTPPTGSGVLSRRPKTGNRRMIPCPKDGSRSGSLVTTRRVPRL